MDYCWLISGWACGNCSGAFAARAGVAAYGQGPDCGGEGTQAADDGKRQEVSYVQEGKVQTELHGGDRFGGCHQPSNHCLTLSLALLVKHTLCTGAGGRRRWEMCEDSLEVRSGRCTVGNEADYYKTGAEAGRAGAGMSHARLRAETSSRATRRSGSRSPLCCLGCTFCRWRW